VGTYSGLVLDLSSLGLACLDPRLSWAWYQDMAVFAEGYRSMSAERRIWEAHRET